MPIESAWELKLKLGATVAVTLPTQASTRRLSQ